MLPPNHFSSFIWLKEFSERVKEVLSLLPRSTSRVAISVSSPEKASSRKGFLGRVTSLGSGQNVPVMDGAAWRPFALLLQGDRPHTLSPFQQAVDGNRLRLTLDETANHPRDGLAGLAVDQRETDPVEVFL